MDPATVMAIISIGLYTLATAFTVYPFAEKEKPEIKAFQKDISKYALPDDEGGTTKKSKKNTKKKKK